MTNPFLKLSALALACACGSVYAASSERGSSASATAAKSASSPISSASSTVSSRGEPTADQSGLNWLSMQRSSGREQALPTAKHQAPRTSTPVTAVSDSSRTAQTLVPTMSERAPAEYSPAPLRQRPSSPQQTSAAAPDPATPTPAPTVPPTPEPPVSASPATEPPAPAPPASDPPAAVPTEQKPAPSLAISVAPNPAKPGEKVTVSWQAQGVDYCEASGGWSGSKTMGGQEQVGPFTADQRFLLSCSQGGSGINSESYLVVQNSGPVSVELFVKRKKVLQGKSASIYWRASNADTCSADGDWSGNQPVTGEYTSERLQNSATFILNCRNKDTEAKAMVSVATIKHLLSWKQPKSYTDGSPLEVGGYKIYWGKQSQRYTRHTKLPPNASSWSAALEPGLYYVAMTTIDKTGIESEPSGEIELTVD